MIDTDKLKPNPFDPFIVIREYVEWYPENAPAIQARGGHTTIAFTVELLAEIKRLREELTYAKVTIDDWDKSGPCVTVYLEGCEYVGMLSLYKDENGKVIE